MLLWRNMKLMSSSFSFSCHAFSRWTETQDEDQIASASWKKYASKQDKEDLTTLKFLGTFKVENVKFCQLL